MKISEEDHKAILNEVVSLRIIPQPDPNDPSKFDIHVNLGFKLQEDMGFDEGWDTIFDVALKRARIAIFTGDGSCLALDENSYGGTEVRQLKRKRGKSTGSKSERSANLPVNVINSMLGRSETDESATADEFEEVTPPHNLQFWDDDGEPTWIITPVENSILIGNVLSQNSDKLASVINPRLGSHQNIRTNHNADPIVRIEIRCKESDWHFDNFRHVETDGSTKAIKEKFDEKSKAAARSLLRRLLTARGLQAAERSKRHSFNTVAQRDKLVE